MGVSKTIISEGSGGSPSPGDTITMQYTGWVKDTSKPGNKGKQFDSSRGRGPFVVPIGIGHLIKGWDEGVPTMKQGEKALLDITPGVPQAGIPPNADLLFEVELVSFRK
ncbi:FK506-binding protein 1 [Geosmithia morbida]|uniref:peptidylprolyl isomerase n=1 Tax=Geosmithia morbida TaxID=1094350 RepID=A0A9P4Z3P0_9HYPO|nr:FK506-binding protein 1 [Geosmithia morbida]KAF4126941.1 FK506-binding protein 1 [Geosmithia morbida]